MIPLTLVLHHELICDYVLDTNLALNGNRRRGVTIVECEAAPVALSARPALTLGTIVYVAADDGSIRLKQGFCDPRFERRAQAVRIERKYCELAISGDHQLVWRLLASLDGDRTTAEILNSIPEGLRANASSLLAQLANLGFVDVDERRISRFLHAATKKGIQPAGGLDTDGVMRLVTDGEYRTYRDSQRVPLGKHVPGKLASFYALTRERRSYTNYDGRHITRNEMESLLDAACGVTGELTWDDRMVKLRAYPSSGALYAIEVYPVVFNVVGLDSAVYHYLIVDNALERLRTPVRRQDFVDAAVPEQREMLEGVAMMVLLTAIFERHERKYGAGGYRILAAEAGHISQNVILAATALGLQARPCGGFFDNLLNDLLGVRDCEQFMLGVLVGRAGGQV